MAVYTEVSDDEIERFLAAYDIGRVVACKGIAEGVENSNFLLQTDLGIYILTLYEKRVAKGDLPFFLGLMDHLAAKGLPCPTPIRTRDGKTLRELAKRPAAIVSFLRGMWPKKIAVAHCAQVGEALARMHLAGADFALRRPNALSLAGWTPLFDGSRERAHEVQQGLAEELSGELKELSARWPKSLPDGVIH